MYMYSQAWKRVKHFWDYKIEYTGTEQYRQKPKV